MLFDDELLELVQSDPIEGALKISTTALQLAEQRSISHDEWGPESHAVFVEAFALLSELIEAGILALEPPAFRVTGDERDDCMRVSSFLRNIEAHFSAESQKIKVSSIRKRYKAALGKEFVYEFSQGDLDRIQELLNQLRKLIAETTGFEPEHQRRLLRRLEKLQAEVHKKVSDLDRFWGLIGDAGVALGKLGTDAKPIVDRIREVTEIVWQTQSRAEELPSGTNLPQLEPPKPPTEA